MKIISLEEFSRINEAITSLQSMVTKEEIEQLSETEFNNLIRFLLLQSGDGGGGMFESLNTVKHLMLENGLVNESRFDTMTDLVFLYENNNQALSEDWDDDVSGAIIGTGAAIGAGAVSMAAYINFLFKKKKIKKAWDEIKDLKKAKSDLDVEEYEQLDDVKKQEEKDIEANKPKLSKEELQDKVDQIKKKEGNIEKEIAAKKEELKNFEVERKPKLEDAKKKVDDIRTELSELDPRSYKNPIDDPEPEGGEKEEPKKEEEPKNEEPKKEEPKKEEKPEKEEKGGKVVKMAASKNQPKGKSINEEGEGDEGPKGILQAAQDKVKEAAPDPDEVADAKEKLASELEANKLSREKIDKSSLSTENKEKAKKKVAKKEEGQRKKVEDIENPAKKKAAQKEVDKIKKDIEGKALKLKGARQEVQKYSDDSGKKDIQDEIDSMNNDLETTIPAELEQARKDAKAEDDMAAKIAEVKEKAKDERERVKQAIADEKETITKQIEDATQNADNISGTSGGGAQAATLTNKALGFSKKYANQVKAENDAELNKHIASNRKKMGLDTKSQDLAMADAQDREAAAKKEVKAMGDNVDGSDKEKQEAIDKVAAKQKAMDDKKNKENEKAEAARKEQEEKEKAKAEKNKMNDNLSFRERYKLAIMEASRKELIPEEDEEKKSSDKKDVSDKPKPFKKKEKVEGDTDGDGQLDPAEKEKQRRKDSEKSNESNPLVGKKVVLRNMRDKDMGHLEGAKGEVVHVFDENEREPEGDLPRRTGDPEVYKIKLDKPKDPMYPEINLTKDQFEEYTEKKEDKAEESIANKFRNALNETKKR